MSWRPTWLTLAILAVVGGITPAMHAAIMSFDFTNSSTGMTPTDLAGAPGVRVGNFNNIAITSNATPAILNTVIDNSGATVSGVGVTFTPGSSTVTPGSASGSNDARLYSNFYDEFGAPAASIQVTNIPYALYDVYFYRSASETNGSIRAGQFTIGAQNRYVRGGIANPAADGTGYVVSNDTTFTPGAPSATTQGNYVVFTGLTDSTLNASFVGVNAGDVSVLRNKAVGFQIVQVPEPSTIALMGLGGVVLLARRRR